MLSFDILVVESGLNLGSNTHTAFPRNIFSSVPVWGWRPIFSTIYSRQEQMEAKIVKINDWAFIWYAYLYNLGQFAFKGSREDLAGLMNDSLVHTYRRHVGPSSTSFSMICSKKGNSVHINIEGLDKGFHLSCQPQLTDSNWALDALLGVSWWLTARPGVWLGFVERIGLEPRLIKSRSADRIGFTMSRESESSWVRKHISQEANSNKRPQTAENRDKNFGVEFEDLLEWLPKFLWWI